MQRLPLAALHKKLKDATPSSLNEVHIILGGLTSGDTNHSKKMHARGLVASHEVFRII